MGKAIRLVRDVLDKQIYDARGEKMGKVDSIVIVLRQHRPPRVDAIELNTVALWSRIHPRVGRLVGRILGWISPELDEPTRVGFERVTRTGVDVSVDVDVRKTNAYVLETWLKQHFVDHIPGGASDGQKA